LFALNFVMNFVDIWDIMIRIVSEERGFSAEAALILPSAVGPLCILRSEERAQELFVLLGVGRNARALFYEKQATRVCETCKLQSEGKVTCTIPVVICSTQIRTHRGRRSLRGHAAGPLIALLVLMMFLVCVVTSRILRMLVSNGRVFCFLLIHHQLPLMGLFQDGIPVSVRVTLPNVPIARQLWSLRVCSEAIRGQKKLGLLAQHVPAARHRGKKVDPRIVAVAPAVPAVSIMVIVVFAVPAVPTIAGVFEGHVFKLVAGPIVSTLLRLGRMHFARHGNRCAQRKCRAHAEAYRRGHPHCPSSLLTNAFTVRFIS